ncbi:MAG TPA: alpha/beta fold hydrolase [Solirubrobacterales bacterium]|nr:alpha/beta fold hydrolase [Solirubrobacterales bacterium]
MSAAAAERAPDVATVGEKLVERFDPAAIDVPGGAARIRLEVVDGEDHDVVIALPDAWLEPAAGEADARLIADERTWEAIADDLAGSMQAFRRGHLRVRDNLHLGVGLLAATAPGGPGRLRFGRIEAAGNEISYCEAGEGPPLLCLHGLGGTKASFLPTLAALAPEGHRVIAIDLPGFGDSSKPHAAPYDAPWFATVVGAALDAFGYERANIAGNSMGGRIAIELGMSAPERVDRLVLLAPALAWLRERPWKWILQVPLPRLGYLQPTPRRLVDPIVRRLIPGGDRGWTAAGVDEFLRAYLTPAGRFAFYECLRNVYLDEPYGEEGFWTRLKRLEPGSLFVWGREDVLVPISFMRHVERALPAATHLELDCGHVPQLERPEQVHESMAKFLED